MYRFQGIVALFYIKEIWGMNDDFKFEKSSQLTFNCPLLPFMDCCKKDKKCCKKHKEGDRCKKCPGKKK